MRLSKYFLTLLFAACAGLAFAQQNDTLSLQKCLEIAVQNNLQVKQTGLTMESARINYLQSKENLLPSISGNVSRQLSQGRNINPVTNTVFVKVVITIAVR